MALPALLAPLGGVADILRGDRGGIAKLGSATNAGLVASFVIPAILLVIPYAYLVAQRFESMGIEPDIGTVLTIEPIAYIIGWTLFPVVSHFYCQRLGRSRDWYDYIAAYNWSNVLQMGLYFPAAVLYDLDLAPALLFVVSVLVVSTAILIHFRVARLSLRIEPLPALILVAMDLALSLSQSRIIERLYT
jgi:hypothetical protein